MIIKEFTRKISSINITPLTIEEELLIEKNPITSVKTDGANNVVIYYQNDEPVPEEEVPLSLEEKIKIRCDLTNAKTKEIIYRGFTFNGKLFSNSEVAQNNYNGMLAGLNAGIILSQDFPLPLSCMDETQYNLQENEVNDFFKAHLLSIASAKFSGTALKEAYLNAKSIEELDLILDNR